MMVLDVYRTALKSENINAKATVRLTLPTTITGYAHQAEEVYRCPRHYMAVAIMALEYLIFLTTYSPTHVKFANAWLPDLNTASGQKDIPKQKIKLEVANVPAYTKEALPLRNNYDFLPDGYEDTLVFTETLDEVMADKLISLPATQRYIRHRDLWDLVWLQQQNARLNPELIRLKLADYKIPDYQLMLESRIASLDDIVASAAFQNEMKHFLPTNVYDRTLGQDKFKSFMLSSLKKMLIELHTQLFGSLTPEPEFKL